MSQPFTERLRAAAATGTPPTLSVIDFSLGGLLVQAEQPFELGSIVRLMLSTADGTTIGTFSLRCLHAHRTAASNATGAEAHISALVFADPLDELTADLLVSLAAPRLPHQPQDRHRGLRLASRRTADFQE